LPDAVAVDPVRKEGYREMERRTAVGLLRERQADALPTVETLPVAGDDGTPRSVLALQSLELDEPDRRPQLVEPVVEAREADVVGVRVPAMAIPGQRRHPV